MRSRRQFLGETSCAAIGSTSILSTLLNLTMANHAAAQGGMGDQRKALVCLFLSGGCDTFNLLIPRDKPGAYDDYEKSRSGLAIPKDQLLPLNFTDNLGRRYGLHPSCTRLAENPAALVDHIDLLICAGTMTARTRGIILTALSNPALSQQDRVALAIWTAMISPEGVVQK